MELLRSPSTSLCVNDEDNVLMLSNFQKVQNAMLKIQ